MGVALVFQEIRGKQRKSPFSKVPQATFLKCSISPSQLVRGFHLGKIWATILRSRFGRASDGKPRELTSRRRMVSSVAHRAKGTASGWTPSSVAESFRAWFEVGRLRGLGSSTLKALRDLAAGAHWGLAGARGEYAAGAGAAMRIAPLAFLLDPCSVDDRVVVRDVARITHHSDEAYAGALAVMVAVRASAVAGCVPGKLWSCRRGRAARR